MQSSTVYSLAETVNSLWVESMERSASTLHLHVGVGGSGGMRARGSGSGMCGCDVQGSGCEGVRVGCVRQGVRARCV